MKKNGGQGNKCALKEKEIEVSVDCSKENRRVYVITNYLNLINVEVSRSINFNFNRQSTDKLPTDYQQSADMLPTVSRLSTDRSLKLWGENCRLTVGQQLANSQPTVGQITITVNRSLKLWKNCQPTVDQLSADSWWR